MIYYYGGLKRKAGGFEKSNHPQRFYEEEQ
jgi:hypothetical protein